MISFRPIEINDLIQLRNWRNSAEVLPYVREYRLLNSSDQKTWFKSYLGQRRSADFDTELFIMSYKETETGCGGFTRIEWRNQKAELTFYIGETEFRKPLIIKELLLGLLEKGFNEWNFNKIYWPVFGHDPNLEIYAQVFITESVMKDEYYWAGAFQDRHYLALTKKIYLQKFTIRE